MNKVWITASVERAYTLMLYIFLADATRKSSESFNLMYRLGAYKKHKGKTASFYVLTFFTIKFKYAFYNKINKNSTKMWEKFHEKLTKCKLFIPFN